MTSDQRFWGHVDFRFAGPRSSVGGPISVESARLVRQRLADGDNAAWAVFDTLSNRRLMVRLSSLQRAILIDDGSPWPAGKRPWETTLDDYAGIPLDTYRAMAMWADDEWYEWTVDDTTRGKALALIEQGGFSARPSELGTLLRHTVVHFIDGTTTSYHADRQHLAELADIAEDGDTGIVPLRERDDDFECDINLSQVRVIDISLIEVLAAHEDIEAED